MLKIRRVAATVTVALSVAAGTLGSAPAAQAAPAPHCGAWATISAADHVTARTCVTAALVPVPFHDDFVSVRSWVEVHNGSDHFRFVAARALVAEKGHRPVSDQGTALVHAGDTVTVASRTRALPTGRHTVVASGRVLDGDDWVPTNPVTFTYNL